MADMVRDLDLDGTIIHGVLIISMADFMEVILVTTTDMDMVTHIMDMEVTMVMEDTVDTEVAMEIGTVTPETVIMMKESDVRQVIIVAMVV
jgi:hypothetical protein